MLADPRWPQFHYRLGNHGQQRMGFAVLTWRSGVLQPPELCECVDGAAWFRGEVVAGRLRVKARSVAA